MAATLFVALRSLVAQHDAPSFAITPERVRAAHTPFRVEASLYSDSVATRVNGAAPDTDPCSIVSNDATRPHNERHICAFPLAVDSHRNLAG